ncbi:MAG TPA: NPCBM/NEW2 domain-containing protein [Gemmataceae bacterium]|nr:NPCBM/NEW2 domain-containing protein [Gemmataceae bacterium]
MRVSQSLLILAATCGAGGLVCATLGATQIPVPAYVLETARATHASADLISLDVSRNAVIDDGGTRRTIGPLIELRRANRALPALPERHFALLTNGDRIPLEPTAPIALEGNRLRLIPAKSLPGAIKSLSLYAPHVVAVFWSAPAGVDDAGIFFGKIQQQTRPRDVVYLTNGDRIEGALTDLSAKGCVIAHGDKKTSLPVERIAGIAWNTDNQARLRSRKAYFRAVLAGGARINFAELRLDEKTRRWTGKTQFDAALEMPEDAVLALDERQGQAVDLADLKPTRYEYRPYLGAAWPLALDRSVSGHPLQLGGSTFEKGLGTHASCSITYRLDNAYQRFDSDVGIDAEHAPRGRARIAIELDGKRVELAEGKELTAKSAPVQVRMAVRGVRVMTLIVDTGSYGDVQAEVNWAKARLIKR